MAVIYGVDTSSPISPIQVRDAIISCFSQAHCQDSGITDSSLNTTYCHDLVKKMLADNGGSFEHPIKHDLEKLVTTLVTFSQNFRDPSIVTRHAAEIQTLLDLLPQN